MKTVTLSELFKKIPTNPTITIHSDWDYNIVMFQNMTFGITYTLPDNTEQLVFMSSKLSLITDEWNKICNTVNRHSPISSKKQ